MLKINHLCAAAALAFAPFALADELSSTGEFVDGIAAVVDEGVVLKSQLAEQTAMITERAAQQDIPLPPPAELREQLLERLIVTEIQLQRANRIGLRVSDQMVNESIGRIADQNGVSFDDMPALLAADGVDYGKFRRDMHEEITLEQLRRTDVGRRIAVSPRELEMCIADLEDNVAINSDYNLSNITLSMPESASSAQIKETLAEAQGILDRVNDGAEFAALAIRFKSRRDLQCGYSIPPAALRPAMG